VAQLVLAGVGDGAELRVVGAGALDPLLDLLEVLVVWRRPGVIAQALDRFGGRPDLLLDDRLRGGQGLHPLERSSADLPVLVGDVGVPQIAEDLQRARDVLEVGDVLAHPLIVGDLDGRSRPGQRVVQRHEHVLWGLAAAVVLPVGQEREIVPRLLEELEHERRGAGHRRRRPPHVVLQALAADLDVSAIAPVLQDVAGLAPSSRAAVVALHAGVHEHRRDDVLARGVDQVAVAARGELADELVVAVFELGGVDADALVVDPDLACHLATLVALPVGDAHDLGEGLADELEPRGLHPQPLRSLGVLLDDGLDAPELPGG